MHDLAENWDENGQLIIFYLKLSDNRIVGSVNESMIRYMAKASQKQVHFCDISYFNGELLSEAWQEPYPAIDTETLNFDLTKYDAINRNYSNTD